MTGLLYAARVHGAGKRKATVWCPSVRLSIRPSVCLSVCLSVTSFANVSAVMINWQCHVDAASVRIGPSVLGPISVQPVNA